MTVREVLKQVSNDLEKLKVPVTELKDIGAPIAAAVSNIRMCIEAMDIAEKEAKEKAPNEEGGEVDEQHTDV